jgi:NAD(P)H-flavin reductase
MNPVTFYPCVVNSTSKLPASVTSLVLHPQDPFFFMAGQYVDIKIDDHDDPRPFSIANTPNANNLITLHIRNTGAGLSHRLCALNLNDGVYISPAKGLLRADTSINRPVLMVAGGTGIAPILALTQDIIRRGYTEHGIKILYGVRTFDDIYCQPELDALQSTGEVTIDYAIGDDTPDHVLARMEGALDQHAIYLSGPRAMIDTAVDILYMRRAQQNLIFSDMPFKALP